jgi:hypothetical protein
MESLVVDANNRMDVDGLFSPGINEAARGMVVFSCFFYTVWMCIYIYTYICTLGCSKPPLLRVI